MAIPTEHLDSGADKPGLARPALLQAVEQLNLGAAGMPYSQSDTFPDGVIGGAVRKASPAQLFATHLSPHTHLRQFSTRRTSAGAGFLAGAVTIAAGAITAVAVDVGGANYSSSAQVRVLITGDGTGAAATATVAGGIVTAINITAGGAGYTTASVYVVDGPVVVLVGDSISTEAPTPSNEGQSLWYLLKDEITKQNPRKSITFFNRAVGSQTFTTFNAAATSNWPTWYSNQAKAWVDYIAELQPDLVVIAFGMNDRQDMVVAQFKAAIAKLLAFATVPDLVFCTPLVPSAISADTSISSAASQLGRDFVAGYLRGYAEVNRYGLLDFNRQLRLMRDGFDVRNSALKSVAVAGLQALPYTAASSGADFYIAGTFASVAAWPGNVDAALSLTGTNHRQFVRVEDAAGKVKVSVIDYEIFSATEVVQVAVTSSMTTPTAGDVTVGVMAIDQHLVVTVNGTIVFDRPIARHGGTFAPTFACVGESATIQLRVGEYVTYNSRLNDVDLFGTSPANAYGGNALNHPTSTAVKHVFAPVVQAAHWAHSPLSHGGSSNGVSNNVGNNEPNPRALYHVTKTKANVTLTPASNANNLLLEDATAPGMSLMSQNTGVARWVAGDDGNASQFVMAYNHNSDTFTIAIGGVTIFSITASLLTSGLPHRLKSYTVATLPAAASSGDSVVTVTDETGGYTLAFSDGANWRRVTDRAIVS